MTTLLIAIYVLGVVCLAAWDYRHVGDEVLTVEVMGVWTRSLVREYDVYDCLKTGLLWPVLAVAFIVSTPIYLLARLVEFVDKEAQP